MKLVQRETFILLIYSTRFFFLTFLITKIWRKFVANNIRFQILCQAGSCLLIVTPQRGIFFENAVDVQVKIQNEPRKPKFAIRTKNLHAIE